MNDVDARLPEPSRGPLSGLTVVEIAGIGPAPFACLLLAELGADVVRVDRPGGAGLDAAPSQTLNRSRPNLAVDLKRPEGRDVVLRLIETADVLVEGLRPGVTERLGIGPDDCHARNPRLVYARMTGWGQDGPLARTAGHDITYAALTGALHATGPADRPRQAVNLVADYGGGSMFLIMGILAALHERQSSGLGQVVDAAMVDGAASLMTMVYGLHAEGTWTDRREANLLDGGAPFYDTYRCSDGKHVAVGALEPQFYARLLEGLGVTPDGDQHDRDQWPGLKKQFTDAFASRTRDEWSEVFAETDACVAPVLSLEEAPQHPHLLARGVFREVAGGYEPRVAPNFSRTPGRLATAARAAGADSRSTLSAAGLTDDEIATLVSAGVVHEA
ncbi:MAG: L-carnitine dehydratase/bile acid-inducible protein [Marmoricola sp.]|nr:L-carnitine dehydratase/bile acid-inducible protein [Marmoricola sp.]